MEKNRFFRLTDSLFQRQTLQLSFKLDALQHHLLDLSCFIARSMSIRNDFGNDPDETSPLIIPSASAQPLVDRTTTTAANREIAMAVLSTLAAVYGGTAVMLGAFGAHGLKKHISEPHRIANWGTAAQYQLMHSVALLVVSSLAPQTRAHKWAGGFFVAGMTMFSGSLYLLVLNPERFRPLGPVTPLGGLCLIAGWGTLAVASRGRVGLGALGGR